MLQWCTYKIWTVKRFCSFNNSLVCIQYTLSSRALGLAAVQPLGRVRTRAKESCIQQFSTLFLIVFLAKYLFFNWSYSTISFEFVKIFFFVSKKNLDTPFLEFKKGVGVLILELLPKKLFHNIGAIQKTCDITFVHFD